MNSFAKFSALSWGERFLLVESWFSLGVARFVLLTIPFRYIAPRLGKQFEQGQIPVSSGSVVPIAQKIGWAVDVMSRRTPWKSACLAQAIAGKFMLRQRGETSMLFLGVKKDDTGAFTAHAWLKNGDEIILGGAGHETFTILSAFVENDL